MRYGIRYRVLVLLLGVLGAWACVAEPEAEPEREARVREMLQGMGIEGSLAEWRDMAVRDAEQFRSSIDPYSFGLIEQALRESFDPELQLPELVAHFVANYDTEGVEATLEWLETPGGRAVAQAADRARQDPERFIQELSTFKQALDAQPPPEERIALVTRFNVAARNREQAADLIVGVARAVWAGLRPILPDPQQLSAEEIDRRFEAARLELVEKAGPDALTSGLFTFRSLSLEALRQHVAASESAGFQWYSEQISAAAKQALKRAGEDFREKVELLVADSQG